MRKIMITMATVALTGGLFAGTSFAGGDEDEGGHNITNVQKGCSPNQNSGPSLLDAIHTLSVFGPVTTNSAPTVSC